MGTTHRKVNHFSEVYLSSLYKMIWTSLKSTPDPYNGKGKWWKVNGKYLADALIQSDLQMHSAVARNQTWVNLLQVGIK